MIIFDSLHSFHGWNQKKYFSGLYSCSLQMATACVINQDPEPDCGVKCIVWFVLLRRGFILVKCLPLCTGKWVHLWRCQCKLQQKHFLTASHLLFRKQRAEKLLIWHTKLIHDDASELSRPSLTSWPRDGQATSSSFKPHPKLQKYLKCLVYVSGDYLDFICSGIEIFVPCTPIQWSCIEFCIKALT